MSLLTQQEADFFKRQRQHLKKFYNHTVMCRFYVKNADKERYPLLYLPDSQYFRGYYVTPEGIREQPFTAAELEKQGAVKDPAFQALSFLQLFDDGKYKNYQRKN